MFKTNPYRAGAGLMPVVLAGRDDEIQNMVDVFHALKLNVPTPSMIYTGLRGVGKTVLINTLQEKAEREGIFCRHIEVETRNDFISQISVCTQTFLREVRMTDRAKMLVGKCIDAIKALRISFDPNDATFELSVQERELYQSNSLTQSLTEVFVSVGKVAYESETPICFFIDEIQYMKSNELGSLIAALHRTNQLCYPIMIIGAGLPKIIRMLSEEKSYAERLFMYREIGSLTEDQSTTAIVEPANKFGVSYTQDAIKEIINVTKGYPYFIQQLCQVVYNKTDGEIIDVADVEYCLPLFFHTLDKAFFKARYERCSDSEKKFLFAMVKCGELPCSIANIAKNLKKNTQNISPARAKLIDKGIIYSTRYKQLDFTVPEFTGFIQRLDEYKGWLENTE